MRFDGIHHITCITGDAPANVDFYTGALGLRLVKKTVNQDDPTVYHLFYADEQGSPGADLTFFEYPGAVPGPRRRGDGLLDRLARRLCGGPRLLGRAARRRADGRHRRLHRSRKGSSTSSWSRTSPTSRSSPTIPRSHVSSRSRASRARARTRATSTLRPRRSSSSSGSSATATTGDTRGDSREGWIEYNDAPEAAGIPGAGTVHHIAWASTMDDHEAWQKRVADAGGRPTPIIDRFWFRSIYFREPSGVLFEIATLGPGFATDEDPAHLGEKLILPPAFEHLRAEVEPMLTPLPNPRERGPVA